MLTLRCSQVAYLHYDESTGGFRSLPPATHLIVPKRTVKHEVFYCIASRNRSTVPSSRQRAVLYLPATRAVMHEAPTVRHLCGQRLAFGNTLYPNTEIVWYDIPRRHEIMCAAGQLAGRAQPTFSNRWLHT